MRNFFTSRQWGISITKSATQDEDKSVRRGIITTGKFQQEGGVNKHQLGFGAHKVHKTRCWRVYFFAGVFFGFAALFGFAAALATFGLAAAFGVFFVAVFFTPVFFAAGVFFSLQNQRQRVSVKCSQHIQNIYHVYGTSSQEYTGHGTLQDASFKN